MSTAVDVLEFSRDLIKAGWTRGVWAEDCEGNCVDINDPDACQFCLLGALKRAQHVLKPNILTILRADDALVRALPKEYRSPIKFNDDQLTEERVIDLVDRAIAALKESA